MIHDLTNRWVLETRSTTYALGLNPDGLLLNLYWGLRLPYPADLPPAAQTAPWASFESQADLSPEEYPVYGGMRFAEPCLKATFADCVRDVSLRFAAAEIRTGEVDELILRFEDTVYPLAVALHYRVHTEYDLIERWVEIANLGEDPVLLERVFSARWNLPAGENYRLSHLGGRWFDDFHLWRELLTPGVKVLESRRLTTGHQHNPWFAVDRGGAEEEAGEVWFGVLAWSGNWKLTAEVTEFCDPRLGFGINDWDFAWRLGPGERFTTPPSLGGYTAGGFGAASRRLHDYSRDRLLPHRRSLHKVLYNSWEAVGFEVGEASQIQLAELAAEIGVELFVMDDGWFHRRNHDYAGLGDWRPDAKKFPHGLGPLIRRVNELGMDFGLWVEPEMVNPDSDLYRAHQDWVLHYPTRPRTEARNQLILNLARPDVQDHLIEAIGRLLAENNIAFIKWDMNRNASEPGWPGAPGDPREIWVRYVQGLYRVWGELGRRHPEVIFQSCSGGGGRADLGILYLADQIWVSDNTDPTARLGIQEGFSQVFPASTMEAWVTDMGREYASLDFRFHVSMCGSLGVGSNLLRWTPAERKRAAKWIALYKEIRPVVQLGDLYRLLPAQGHGCTAVQYLSQDGGEGVLFAFRTQLPVPARMSPITLRGLEPEARYTVEGFTEPRSGQEWMSAGLTLPLGNFESAVRRIVKEE